MCGITDSWYHQRLIIYEVNENNVRRQNKRSVVNDKKYGITFQNGNVQLEMIFIAG